jgi:hypothetical protein
MIEFISELERILVKWPEGAVWKLSQLADYTRTPSPKVADFFFGAFGRTFDIEGTVSREEAQQALTTMKETFSGELQARQKFLEERQQNAVRDYDRTMDRVRALQQDKNWHNAYRTLTYYFGRYEKDIPCELLVDVCNDCLRLGIKAQVNLQELGVWMRKIVDLAHNTPSEQALENVLDFIDAYGTHFAKAPGEQGRKLLRGIMGGLKETFEQHGLTPRLDALTQELALSEGALKQ